MHHGRIFQETIVYNRYIGGMIDYFDDLAIVELSLPGFDRMVEDLSLNYGGYLGYYCRGHNVDGVLD